MVQAHEQLDRRFAELAPLTATSRPSRGWIRAIREALGMTTAQLAHRMGVKQPRVVELEKNEVQGNVTLHSLERAAEALGCRLVYTFVPVKPLGDTMQQRAEIMTDRQLASLEQTMRLEDQSVTSKDRRREIRQRFMSELMRRPARLWDEP